MSAVTSTDLSAGMNTLDLLVFWVGGQTFGLPIPTIDRIIDMVSIIQLPGGPDMIQGVINVQGKAVPVIDLGRRFGLPLQAYGLYTPIILTNPHDDGYKLGLIVDKVEDVVQVSCEDLEIAEAFIPTEMIGQISAHLAGVAKVGRRMVIVLEARALLSPVEENELSLALVTEYLRVD